MYEGEFANAKHMSSNVCQINLIVSVKISQVLLLVDHALFARCLCRNMPKQVKKNFHSKLTNFHTKLIHIYWPVAIRGMLGTCFQLFLTVGILFVYILGSTGCNWVLLSWFCLVIPILNLIGLCFIPESPTWLLKNVSVSICMSKI